MNPVFYNVINTIRENNYKFETVESGGRQGVRCVAYLTKNDIFGDIFDKYDNTKYGYLFRKFISHRHPELVSYKFDNIVWCWPYDKFDFETGKQMAKERVLDKIKSKKNRIKQFIKKLEKFNMK